MSFVLDASALLAVLKEEPGAEVVAELLENSHICTVNWTEVVQKLEERGDNTSGVQAKIAELGVIFHDFTIEDSEHAAYLRRETKRFGFSLGDRACLALAHRLKARPVTADKAWGKFAHNALVIR